MYVHKLHIAEFDKIDYQLIAIHSPLEDYRLAYFINKQLPINLKNATTTYRLAVKRAKRNLPDLFLKTIKTSRGV